VKDKIMIEIKLEDITEIRVLTHPRESGLDIRVRNYPYDDLSIETKEFNSVKELVKYFNEKESE
jgi:hypothetical protein